MGKYDALKLENQLCFPLYAASREMIKLYRPFLQKLDLTYTQYIVMQVLWERESVSVRDMGHVLHLDSGTLTPVLKSLEAKGLVKRYRCTYDERVLIAEPTPKAMELRDNAMNVPEGMGECPALSAEEYSQLYGLLYKLLDRMEEE